MKEAPILKAEAPSIDMLGVAVAGHSLLKARISAYTRKDGVFVAEHDDKRAAAKPKAPAAKPVAKPAPEASSSNGGGSSPASGWKEFKHVADAEDHHLDTHFDLEQAGYKRVKTTHANPQDVRSKRTHHWEHPDGRTATTSLHKNPENGWWRSEVNHSGKADAQKPGANQAAKPAKPLIFTKPK